ncbi:uncharacterized protein [Eleutherodactylus coqui]|uniref:uncharacterized protein n=1 Tax=Eleutherodactylus coqui TaxID=57060 RepID=UPI003461A8AC
MEASRLLLMFFIIQGGSCNDEDPYCTEQRGSTAAEENGSITISCNFTYPKKIYRPEDVRISWRRGNTDRCGNGLIIYNHTGGWTHDEYMGRISAVGNHNDGTATITINNLRRGTDRQIFCCRVEVFKGSKYIEGWQNPPGTSIHYKGQLSVEQTDVVPAIIGEDITIPCVVRYRDPSLITEVSWSVGSSDLCADNTNRPVTWINSNKSEIRGRWSVVDFPDDLSLRITAVTAEDNKKYCCRVRWLLRDRDRPDPVQPIRGTEVIVVDASQKPKFEVVQPATISCNQSDSATLSCSYTPRSDPLWTVVFWRVGSPNGSYAYHPLQEMVAPSYRGRTELRGTADLHIKGVDVTDNTTYYCFVMLKSCVGKLKTSSTIQYGSGTNLQVTDPTDIPGSIDQVLIAVIYVGVKNLIFLVLVILSLLYLKKISHRPDEEYEREDKKHLICDSEKVFRAKEHAMKYSRAEENSSVTKSNITGFFVDSRKENTLILMHDETTGTFRKCTIKESHMTVTEGPAGRYLTHYTLEPKTRAAKLASLQVDYSTGLNCRGIDLSLKLIGRDTTYDTSGWKRAMLHCVEELLTGRLFRYVCWLHINEQPFDHILA